MIIEEGTPVPSTGPRRSPWTVAVVAAVAALAVAIGGVAGAFLTNGRIAGAGAGAAAAYVPADAFFYLETRLDLPGDQRQMLRQVLERFEPLDVDTILGPGLASWLDDQLARDHAGGTGPDVTYSQDVAPWFTGQFAVAVTDYPSTTSMPVAFPNGVALIGSRDQAAAAAFADKLRAAAQPEGASFSSQSHAGVDVWSLVQGKDANALGAMTPGFAYAVTADQVVVGSGADAVNAALDVHAGNAPSLAERADFNAAAARLPNDRVAYASVDYAPMLEKLRGDMKQLGGGADAFIDQMAAAAPHFALWSARFEAERLVFDAVVDRSDAALAPDNHARSVARWVPGDAIFFADSANLGKSFAAGLSSMQSSLGATGNNAQLKQIEDALGGDLESFVDWIGDGGMAAGWDGAQPYAGLVLIPNDADAARQRLGQLVALAQLGEGRADGLSISDEQVDGVTVTTFHFGPSGFAVQYAVTDERVLIGFGDRFVKNALKVTESDSLAASARYRQAIDQVGGAANAGAMYLDLAALRGALESGLPADARSDYEAARPYLEPFDYVAGTTRADGDLMIGRMAIVVR